MKMNIIINKSRKRDGKKTKKRNKDEKQEESELIIITCPNRTSVHKNTSIWSVEKEVTVR
jgi:hypothetical protein